MSAMRKPHKAGTLGWVGLAAYVYAWDTLAPETLSSAYWRAYGHRVGRPIVIFATVWTVSHLVARKPARLLIRW